MLHATWVLAAREIKTSGERVEQTKNGLISPKNRLKRANFPPKKTCKLTPKKQAKNGHILAQKNMENGHNCHFGREKADIFTLLLFALLIFQ